MRIAATALLSLLVLFALGCQPTKHDLLEAAKDIERKDELQAKLGDPDDRTKLGPVETWTYDARDGSVTFLITGSTVALQSTGGARED